MFVVTEADAAAIRAAFNHGGEFSAAVELRRRFPGIADNAQAREFARTIAAWKPLTLRKVRRPPVLRTVLSTARKQGWNLLQTLTSNRTRLLAEIRVA